MENTTAPPQSKPYLTAVGMALLIFGLTFILAYIFNRTATPVEPPNFVTIHGADRNYNIVGRRLVTSEGNYFTNIFYGRGVKMQAGKFIPLARQLKAIQWPPECPTYYYPNASWVDCLTLNVYQCTSMQDHTLPVLVYVHEGESNWDSTANLDATQVINNLACKGMVVVSVHYRQSIFGALNFVTPIPAVSDIQLALEWVNKTIHNFNGNPSQVTLMGSRRGAQIVSYLSRIPKARALFQQEILVGGAADDPDIFSGDHRFLYRQIHKIATRVNCSSADEDPETMKRKELTAIILCLKAQRKSVFMRSDYRLRSYWNRWPLDTSELDWNSPMPPIKVMLGACRNPPPHAPQQINPTTLENALNKNGDLKRTHDPKAFVDHYFNRYSNASMNALQIMRLARYDFLEVGPLLLEAHHLATQPNSNVFMFNLETNQSRYDYNPEVRRIPAEVLTPCLEHMLFRKAPESDQAAQKFMVDSVANFVINGNPNKPNDLKWAEFNATSTLNTYNVLNVNAEGTEVVENWELNSAKFWLCERDRARNLTVSAYCS